MGIPLHFGRWKRKQSLVLLVVLPISTTLWAGTIVSWHGVYWEWTQMALAAFALVAGWEVLQAGLASLVLASRLNQDTLVSLAALAGFCFGFLVCVLQSTGFLSSELQSQGSLAGPFFAAATTVVAGRLLNGYLRNRLPPTTPWDDTFLTEPLHPLLRPAIFFGFALGLAFAVPQAWPTGGIPAVVSLTVALLAALSPEAFHLTNCVLRRCADEALPACPSHAQLVRVAELDTVLVEKSQVLTTGHCELRDVVALDSGTCDEEILHFAAVAEFLLPPNAIRSAVLKGARDAVRTVPTLKGYQHMPGRGVSARYRNQQLLFGNLEWLREKGHSQENLAEVREDTRQLYEKGETVLYVSLQGKILGAIGLYDPPRPEIESFIRELQELNVKACVVTGDSPDTVKGLLKDHPGVEFIAGLRPHELVDHLRERKDLGHAVGLVAKKDSLLASSSRSLAPTIFELNRKGGFTATTSPRESPLDLQGDSLDRISRFLRLARKLVTTEKNRVRLLAAYHLLLVPAALSAAACFISWKFYGFLGILMGALIPTLVVPSECTLRKALAARSSSDDRGTDGPAVTPEADAKTPGGQASALDERGTPA